MVSFLSAAKIVGVQPLTEGQSHAYTTSAWACSPAHGTGQVKLRRRAWVLLKWGVENGVWAVEVVRNHDGKSLRAAVTERPTSKCKCKIRSDLRLQVDKNSTESRSRKPAAGQTVLSRYFRSCPLRGLLSLNFESCQDRAMWQIL